MKGFNDAVKFICLFILAMHVLCSISILFALLSEKIDVLAMVAIGLIVSNVGCVWFIVIPQAWGKGKYDDTV